MGNICQRTRPLLPRQLMRGNMPTPQPAPYIKPRREGRLLNEDEAGPPAPDPSSSATTSAAPTPEPSGVAGGASVCGLGGEKLSG